MLNPQDTETLRARVRAAQSRPLDGPWQWGAYADGPLAGLRARLGAGANVLTGWCQPTRDGPVVALYAPGEKDGEWRFKGFERPGHGAR